MKYMRRVSAELETVGGGPEEEELIVQGVRFAFRVHQVKKKLCFLFLIRETNIFSVEIDVFKLGIYYIVCWRI